MYLKSMGKEKTSISAVEEFRNIKDEIMIATGMKEEKVNTPVAVDEEDIKSNENILTIPEGTDGDALGTILMEKGLITDINAYNFLLDDMQIRDKIVPGNYEIPEGIKAKEVLALVTNTELKEYTFTIQEGASIEDVGRMFKDLGIIESPPDFVIACNNLGVTQFKLGEHTIVKPTRVNTIINQLKAN